VSAQARPTADLPDYYQILQLNPNAEAETINRVYRLLAKRYHPDNLATGDLERFNEITAAYKVLSDADQRAAYDAACGERRDANKIYQEVSSAESFTGDRRIFDGILSLLYVARRRDPHRGGIGIIQLERLLGCPTEHLEFHIWYLREKGWLQRLDNGLLAITVSGIDRVIEEDSLLLRRNRLLTESTEDPAGRPEQLSRPNGRLPE